MQIACVEGIAELARMTTSAEAAAAYQGEQLTFGPDYLIPKPFDPRLVAVVSTAVARAAMESGVAERPMEDMQAYEAKLNQSVFKSALLMKPVFEAARKGERRIVFAEGEDERVLRAAQSVLRETTETPILIGRPDVIATRWRASGSGHPPRRGSGDCEPRARQPLPRLLGCLSRADAAPWCHAGHCPRGCPHQHHRHWAR